MSKCKGKHLKKYAKSGIAKNLTRQTSLSPRIFCEFRKGLLLYTHFFKLSNLRTVIFLQELQHNNDYAVKPLQCNKKRI